MNAKFFFHQCWFTNTRHKDTTELAAFALGSMFAGVTGWSIAVGIVTAMDVNKDEFEDEDIIYLGIQLQKTLTALSVFLLPVSILWWNASTLLSILGQNHETTVLAGRRVIIWNEPVPNRLSSHGNSTNMYCSMQAYICDTYWLVRQHISASRHSKSSVRHKASSMLRLKY